MDRSFDAQARNGRCTWSPHEYQLGGTSCCTQIFRHPAKRVESGGYMRWRRKAAMNSRD